jgi:hypothetical protein
MLDEMCIERYNTRIEDGWNSWVRLLCIMYISRKNNMPLDMVTTTHYIIVQYSGTVPILVLYGKVPYGISTFPTYNYREF